MIKVIRGTYGYVTKNGVEAMTKASAPFALSKKREEELVKAGVAVYVEEAAQPKAYENMKMAELRRLAAERGIDAGTIKSKKELIALLENQAEETDEP